MKLLTINTHSLIEENYKKKLLIFADAIEELKPDVIAMQEVNQSIEERPVKPANNFTVLGDIPLKTDNHALNILSELGKRGVEYNLLWVGMKKSYDAYDEGIAIMSKQNIDACDEFTVSTTDDYNNWRRRKIIGLKTKNQWFYSVHLGWWGDVEEPFLMHWERLSEKIKSKENVWLMGDFNSEANVKDEGYSTVLKFGWRDSYTEADKKDDGYTVSGKIDGWENSDTNGKRIDYIFTNTDRQIKSSSVIFDGKNYGIISDHFGIMIETK